MALKDLHSLNQSVLVVMKMNCSAEHQHHFIYRYIFAIYSIIRALVIILITLILIQIVTLPHFYRDPMDITMNFAAFAFVMELDDLVVSNNAFTKYKAEYSLFDQESYTKDQIDEMGTLLSLIPDKVRPKKGMLRTLLLYIKPA